MKKLTLVTAIVPAIIIAAALRLAIPALQSSKLIWLLVVVVGAPWIIWEGLQNLYTAAMHGYILTGFPQERRVYRDEDQRLFRNNVIAWIVVYPVVAAGAVLLVLDALEALY